MDHASPIVPRPFIQILPWSTRAIRQSGAFDGVHIIPDRRYRETAMRLEAVPKGVTG